MPTIDRREIELPAQLLADVSAIAKRRRHLLSVLVCGAVATATKAAERGYLDTLPIRLPDFVGTGEKQKPLRYSMSDEQATRSVASLQAAGSSVRVVALRFFEAYRAADGVLYDVVAPGEPGAVYRAAGAA